VLTQYKSHSLDRHITTTWRMSKPARATTSPRCRPSSGSARAGTPAAPTRSCQSLNLIYDARPDIVVVFGADHVYRMDPAQMIDQHLQTGPAVPSRAAGARAGGHRVRRHRRRRRRPGARLPREAGRSAGLPDSPEESFASMGNYVFTTDALLEALRSRRRGRDSCHDMGGSIMPMLADAGDAWVYDFSTNVVPGPPSATTATGATSGRSTPTSTPTWTSCR
jgi:glucose-1-phosphate adenylyltransferase